MAKKRSNPLRRPILGNLSIILLLVLAACAPGAETVAPAQQNPAVEATPAPPTELPPTEPPPTEPPPTEPPAADPPLDPAEIRFMVTGLPEYQDFLKRLIDAFTQENPQVSVTIEYVPYEDFQARLVTMLAAGTAPDIAMLPLNLMVVLSRMDFLLPLEPLGVLDWEDFLPDAVESARVEGATYGLPTHRFSCAPVYEYLSIFNQTKAPETAFRLADFLARRDSQAQAFQEMKWYPTRASLYPELDLDCAEPAAIRPRAEEVALVIGQVEGINRELEPVLQGRTLSRYKSTIVVENGEVMGSAAAVRDLRADEKTLDLLRTEGLVVGALSIDNAPEYPPGNYAIRCWEEPRCVLERADGTQIEYKVDIAETFPIPVEEPLVVIVPGSREVCKVFLFWMRCTRVG
jgi:hypothetical protein